MMELSGRQEGWVFVLVIKIIKKVWKGIFGMSNKKEENKDKVLFIDARNYYTVVDRTLNEWSEWQMKNLNAIVWLYRGETDKYKNGIFVELKPNLVGLAEYKDGFSYGQKVNAFVSGLALWSSYTDGSEACNG